jgi:hypothetical protein
MSARTDALVSQQETGKIAASIVLRCGRMPPGMSCRFNADSESMFPRGDGSVRCRWRYRIDACRLSGRCSRQPAIVPGTKWPFRHQAAAITAGKNIEPTATRALSAGHFRRCYRHSSPKMLRNIRSRVLF